jgi:ABC-type transport system involved in multi-copper enzyme maturation permease subunit
MPVYDRSYRRWDGQLSRRSLRFIPIASQGIRQALSLRSGWFLKVLYWLLLICCFVPTLVFLFFNYILYYQPQFAPHEMLQWLDRIEPVRVLQYPVLLGWNTLFLMALTVIVGSGLIARDRAAGAMPLYLSRPLTRLDYGLGKFCVLAWFLACITIVPCLLLWLFGVVASKHPDALKMMLPEVPRILLHGGIIVVTYSATMLAVSSLFRRPMFAGLVWFALFVFLPSFLSIASLRLQWNSVPAISPNDAIQSIGFDLWNLDAIQNQPGLSHEIQALLRMSKMLPQTPVEWCWISVVSWIVVSVGILTLVLRRQDVVTDAAR